MTSRQAMRCSRAAASRRRPGRSATRAPGSRCSRQPGVPRNPRGEDRRRGHRAPVHRRRADASRCTSRGTRSTTTRRWPRYADGPGRRARRDQRQRLPGRRLQARQRHQPRPARPAQGDRPPARVRRHHGRHRVARPEAVVLRRHQLPRPGRHPRPAGPARRGAARGLRPARRRPADAAGVQAVRAGLLHHRRARLGHVVRALPASWATKAQVCIDTGHHAPGTNIEFIVAFLLRAGQARRVRLQLAASTPTTT